MNQLIITDTEKILNLEDLTLSDENIKLLYSEIGDKPTLYTIVTFFYKYGIYNGLDLLYDIYSDKLHNDSFMESIFLYLAKLGDEEKIDYFYSKSKHSIKERNSFDRFQQYKEYLHADDNFNYADPSFIPLFDEGLKILCTKKKFKLLKKLYSYGFKASLSQLKAATRTLNEDIFYTVFDELNKKVIADYVPTLIEELCYYSKLEPIKFLFEKIGVDYITQDSLNKCLINSVNGHSKWSKLDIFTYILEIGADISYNNYEVFENIFGYGHTDVLGFLYKNDSKYLFKNDINYNLKKYINIAINYNKLEILQYLILSKNYKNKYYNLLEDKLIVEKYCSQFNKHKDVLEYLIKEIYSEDIKYIQKLKFKYPKQRKLQEFINKLL